MPDDFGKTAVKDVEKKNYRIDSMVYKNISASSRSWHGVCNKRLTQDKNEREENGKAQLRYPRHQQR
ncbi:hypothetical protein SR858_00035 [Duganella zoogloeoides]|uniref:Uncharacterized protein n=1 Tax=Duganella zoogloeoides TaxID=75659 RepID=A0ABZ0XYE5_9BURK|nr:hypothetical protein [Duganella zoogloeoides]WQH04771.1 hypothetical protein SR858_00035 [Duganella zoogloeoides]